MHRIDSATASANENGTGKAGWTEGSPSPLVPPTAGTAAWFNDMQENLAQAVEDSGQTLTKGAFTQLLIAQQIREDRLALCNPTEFAGASGGTSMTDVVDQGTFWLAAGGGGKFQRSVDGRGTWTEYAAAGGYVGALTSICRSGSGGTLIAVGEAGGIQTTTNGTAYTQRTAAAAYAGTFSCVEANGATVIAVGSGGAIQRSTDTGATWAAISPAGGFADSFYSVAYDSTNAIWIAVGDNGEIQYSADAGVTWARIAVTQPGMNQAQVVAKNGGGFIVAKQADGGATISIYESTAASPVTPLGNSASATFASASSLTAMSLTAGGRRVVVAYSTIIRSARVADLTTWDDEIQLSLSWGCNGFGYSTDRKRLLAAAGTTFAAFARQYV